MCWWSWFGVQTTYHLSPVSACSEQRRFCTVTGGRSPSWLKISVKHESNVRLSSGPPSWHGGAVFFFGCLKSTHVLEEFALHRFSTGLSHPKSAIHMTSSFCCPPALQAAGPWEGLEILLVESRLGLGRFQGNPMENSRLGGSFIHFIHL